MRPRGFADDGGLRAREARPRSPTGRRGEPAADTASEPPPPPRRRPRRGRNPAHPPPTASPTRLTRPLLSALPASGVLFVLSGRPRRQVAAVSEKRAPSPASLWSNRLSHLRRSRQPPTTGLGATRVVVPALDS